jgi:hypothetical protein
MELPTATMSVAVATMALLEAKKRWWRSIDHPDGVTSF